MSLNEMTESSSEFDLRSRERLTFEGGESGRLNSLHVVGERTKSEEGRRRHVDKDLRVKDLQDTLSQWSAMIQCGGNERQTS